VKKTLVRGVGAVACAAAAAAMFGSGSAGAINEYVGLTYEKAAEYYGANPIIASRVGSYLPTGQCIITGSRSGSYNDSSGNYRGGLYVDLNCNDTKTAGHPGYSAMTPIGKEAADLRDKASSISTNYAKATEAGVAPACEEYFSNCQQICNLSETCSSELLDYLGM
jgi:hypothetical protein